ncbi:MAG: aspartate-semialdehyde dehydrogenase [Saprospiraceae bacterium]
MKVALVGATGLVGGVMMEVLKERNFPVTELILVASERSVGKIVCFDGKEHTIVSIDQAITMKPDVALFSAGGTTSSTWAPEFAKVGTTVIDNSSAWRMDPTKKLVVPEINGQSLTEEDKIIANPNCSTIQLVVALGPLHKAYGIKRLVISTYQSYTGTGMKAVKQYNAEKDGMDSNDNAYPHPIYENCIPHCDIFCSNGYTKEELKLVNETQKILNSNDIKITATAVRVPVSGGHSEAVNIEFEQEFDVEEVKLLLRDSDGIVLLDDISNNVYPMPLMAKNKDEVFVGRIRRDNSIAKGLNLWIVADNLRKGAATNAIQIAEHLLKIGLLTTKETVMA